MIAEIESPAKINLHLEILNRREDGFHELVSLFHMVDLSDTLIFETNGSDNNTLINGFDFPRENNLIYKAVELFRDASGYKQGLEIDVVKRIPEGAGLGGGSSNAAFTLRALEALSGIKLDKPVLRRIGETLGSDVPFFLFSPAALVKGRGESLTPLTPLFRHEFWLFKPEKGINTASAFAELSQSRNNKPYISQLTYDDIIKAYKQIKPEKWPFFNSFQECFSRNNSEFSEWINLLMGLDPDFLILSGSGSCFVLSFLCPQEVSLLQKRTKFKFPFLKKVFSLDCTPSPVLK